MLECGDRSTGLLLNLTGDGKGKSSSAFGTALRAMGWGWRVAILQFIKNEMPTGERHFFLERCAGTICEACGLGLTCLPGDHAGAARKGWERALELLRDFDGQLLILDELNIAVDLGFLDPLEVAGGLRARRADLNVIVTGRNVHPEIAKISDLVSEVKMVKHPYNDGVPARKGIDY